MVIDHDPVFCKKPWRCSCGHYNYNISCDLCGKTEDVVNYKDPCEECKFRKTKTSEINWRVRDDVKY